MGAKSLKFGDIFLCHLLFLRADKEKHDDTADVPFRVAFAMEKLSGIEKGQNFLKRIIFSDDGTFHVIFNKQN